MRTAEHRCASFFLPAPVLSPRPLSMSPGYLWKPVDEEQHCNFGVTAGVVHGLIVFCLQPVTKCQG
mgnify:CR=1 FL=1